MKQIDKSEFKDEKMSKILTFDCYGTLLDTSPLYNFIGKIAMNNGLSGQKAINTFSSYEDRLMYGEDFINYDKLLFEVLSYCDMEMNCNSFTAQYDKIIAIHREFMPFADVLEALHKLKQNGYSLAVMSNTTNQLMDWHLEKLENLFDDRLVSEDTKCYKPNLSFFEIAERKFNLKMQEHCHIAKGYWWDIVPAKKMEWNKIWVNRSHLSHGKNTESPYLTVSTLSELPQI